jgi:PAS domain S-box-containing protein
LAQKITILEPDRKVVEEIKHLLKKYFSSDTVLAFSCASDFKKNKEVWHTDLLLIACSLPDADVADILQEISRDIPVFLLSGKGTNTKECLNLLARGLTGFIKLPAEEADTVSMIGMALQNRKLKSELLYQSRLYELIRKLGNKFINVNRADIDHAIRESMAKIGEFTGVDRVYLFDYNLQEGTSSNTHEWCAEGISPEIENLQNLPVKSIPEWYNKHIKGETILIPKVHKLKKNDPVRQILEPQGVFSVLSIPMFHENECYGFVGFDSCKEDREWQTDEISILQLFADLLTNLQVKKKFESKLFQVETIYQFIAENINDAVALIDIKGHYTFVSPSHKLITGRGEELIGQYAFQYVHPDDRKLVFSSVFKAMRSDREYLAEYRYLHPEHGYLWYETVGKRHFDKEGNVFGLFATRNIHERKLSEKTLQETKNILKGVMDTIPVRVFWKDKDLKYLGCNLPFALDAGFESPEEIIGKDDFQMPWKNEAKLYRNDDKSVIESGEQRIGYEEPQTSPAGDKLWIRTSKVPLKDIKGQIIGVLGTYEDITQKKLLEDNLRQSEEKYRTLIETSQDGISLMDLEGNILFCNQQKVRMIGAKDPEILIGTNALELIHPEDRSLGIKALGELPYQDHVSNLELRVNKKDGSFFYASFNVSIIKDESGNPIYIIDFMQDITERVQAQQALIEERDFASKVMNTLGQGLTVTNADGVFEYVNPAYAKFLGLKPQDIIGKTPADFTEGNDLFILQNVLKERRKGKKSSYELRLRHVDGHDVPVWITGVPRMEGKSFSGAIAVITDISEQKKAEEALRDSELRFQLLAEVAPVGIFRTDATGYTNYVNPRWCEISKLSFEEAIGSGWLNAVHPDDREIIALNWSKATTREEISETEYRFLNEDGSIAWVIGRAVPQKNRNGKITGYIGTITDITERKNNEAVLLESEERYRHLFERNPAPMLIYEKESLKILAINEAFENHYGYSRKEALQLILTDLYPEEEKKPLARLAYGLRGHANVGEWHHIKKDGTIITIISSSHDINHLNKKARVAVITDISERKKIEEALRESEERFRRLAENADDAIYRIDLVPEPKFSYISPAITRLTGYTPEDHYNDPMLSIKIVHPDDRHLLEFMMNNPDKIRDLFTIRWIRKDGRVLWTEQRNVPVYDAEGRITSVEGIARDITWRKQQEEEITKLSVGVEQSPVLVIITDTEGTISYVNQKFTEVTGYQPEEVIGKNPRILKSGQMSPEEYSELWKTITSGKEWRGEFLNKKKNGELYWESASISPIKNEKGETAFYIGVKEDITERKHMEAELLAAKEKAEESDKLKTAFLNNLSHEIRTPLNAITGFSDLLNTEDIQKEEIGQYTTVIRQSSNQLLSIIDDIVNIATIEAGQVKIIHQETNVNQLMQSLFEQLKIKVNPQKIAFELDQLLPEKEAIINTDDTKLTQILTNLLVNAIKFTETGYVKFGCVRSGKELIFHVKDTGIGVPSHLHEKIFERFRQSDPSVSRKFGGTGLGLSISKSYVELMGGSIWLESEEGKGTYFSFTLPWKPISGSSTQESSLDKVVFDNQKTILIAEDEDFNYLLTEKILSGYNLNFLRAENGKKAVELCNVKAEIAVVLMDIKMPVMNGFEATKLIKASRPDLPVIALTAYAQPGSREEAIKNGCDDYLSKPYTRDELYQIISRYLID